MNIIVLLIIDILASWTRLFVALLLSIIFSIVVGIEAATSSKMEHFILPTIDVLQTVPILGFFPIVIYAVVLLIPGAIGINAAVIFLIFTSMAWNITFGVYEAVKSIPIDIINVAQLNHFTKWKMYKDIYIPASMPKIAYQSVISWSIGLFYLVTSEIFSTGSANFAVTYGIGIAVANLVTSPNTFYYILTLILFIIAVIITRILFLQPLSIFSEKYSFKEDATEIRRSRVLSAYSYIYHRMQKYARPFIAKIKGMPDLKIKKATSYMIVGNPISRYILSRKELALLRWNIVKWFLIVLLIIGLLIAFMTGITNYLPEVLLALAYSFTRIWLTYIICAILAVVIGVEVGLSKRFAESSMAIFQIISAIPATILLPAIVAAVYIYAYGGEMTAIIIIFISMFWYILFSVISGIRTLPNQFLELKEILRLNRVQTWKNIYIPAILPSFITGSITAIGGAWNALIVAEYFTVQSSSGSAVTLTQVGTGIGKTIDVAVFSGNLTLAFLSIIMMTAMVIVINKFVWQKLYNSVTSKYSVGE
jgi:NitT/TauT family transport system permease protein